MDKTQIKTKNNFLSKLRKTLGPLFLILVCPPTVFIFWYTNTVLEGSFQKLGAMMSHEGIFTTIWKIWSPYFFGSSMGWKLIAFFAMFELLLMKFLPGKRFEGPITPKGNIPIYKANGVLAYLLTLAFFMIGSFYLNLFSPTIIYDNFPGILGALNIFSLLFCGFLLVKGHISPSSTDVGSSGNWLFDYYWGMELYPRVLGWDIKQFTNCRFGMMSWPLIIISFAAAQKQMYGVISDSMIVSLLIQLVYITKFFFWETGYLRSLDIMHDRAGYYICWGCLVWVPGIYTSPSLYLVNHPNHLGWFWAGLIAFLGCFFVLVNYWADRQRQMVRLTQGDCKIWGKPAEVITAHYITEQGEHKQNVLLTSGWWGIGRHFHYIPEILGAFFWTVPALFIHFSPYFYVIFLTCLLFDRAFRDEERCQKKYGKDWDLYCQKVPYKIIPGII